MFPTKTVTAGPIDSILCENVGGLFIIAFAEIGGLGGKGAIVRICGLLVNGVGIDDIDYR